MKLMCILNGFIYIQTETRIKQYLYLSLPIAFVYALVPGLYDFRLFLFLFVYEQKFPYNLNLIPCSSGISVSVFQVIL